VRLFKNHILRAVQKCSDARRAITDERFVKPLAFSGKEGVQS